MARAGSHPGEHLALQLEAHHLSPTELARQMQVPTNRITAILHGRRAVTGDTALRLGHFFGTNPRYWLNLQSQYELSCAIEKSGSSVERLPTVASRAEVRNATS